MSLLRRKTAVLPPQKVSIGGFDPALPGGYDNVKTFPLPVRKGRSLMVRMESDQPVDVAVSGPDGRVLTFKEGVKSVTLGPLGFEEKCTAALVLGVYRGDRADVEIEAWSE